MLSYESIGRDFPHDPRVFIEPFERSETMTRQLLIYEEIAPVSRDRHREWSVKAGENYAFARKVNSVPLTAVEFPLAASEFPIVFAPSGDSVVPVALLGTRAEQNVFVDDDGGWIGRYTPAFLRRYPFVFSATAEQGAERFALCIDEKFEGCNQENRGERLFDSDGERTQYLNSVLAFQQEYQSQTLRTQAFCTKLKDFGLLEPMTARVAQRDGAPIGLGGFEGIQRKKLHDLDAEQLEALSTTGELELAYIHLQSLGNFRFLADKAGLPVAEANPDETSKRPGGSSQH